MNSAKRQHAKHRGNMLLTTGKQMYQRDTSFSDDLKTVPCLYKNTYLYIYIDIFIYLFHSSPTGMFS